MLSFQRQIALTALGAALAACAPEPKAPAGGAPIVLFDSARDKRLVVISITKDGKCLYEGTPLSSCDDVFEAAEERLKFAPQTEVVVMYDRAVQQAAVLGVLDQLNRAGIRRVSLSDAEGG